MPTDVLMPQMGESIFEGTITKWLKKPGDTVQRDEPLFEISTDKVDAEIPSPAAGVLTEIRAQEGSTVQVNTVVGVIGDGASGGCRCARGKAAPAKAEAAQRDASGCSGARRNRSRQQKPNLPRGAGGRTSSCRRWASRSSKAPSRNG